MKTIKLTDVERVLAYSALSYMVNCLEEEIQNHGTLTKWSRNEIKTQLIALRAKFELTSQN